MFQLDPQLEKDTVHVASFELCEVLLATDANYPWLIFYFAEYLLGDGLTDTALNSTLLKSGFAAIKVVLSCLCVCDMAQRQTAKNKTCGGCAKQKAKGS